MVVLTTVVIGRRAPFVIIEIHEVIFPVPFEVLLRHVHPVDLLAVVTVLLEQVERVGGGEIYRGIVGTVIATAEPHECVFVVHTVWDTSVDLVAVGYAVLIVPLDPAFFET